MVDSAVEAVALEEVVPQEDGNMKKIVFNDKEKSKIKAAVEALENESSGEIVTYFASKSDDYSEAKWIAALIFMISTAIGLILFALNWWLPGSTGALSTSSFIIASGLIGFSIAQFIPKYRLNLMNSDTIDLRVRQKAIEVFLNEEIFKTRDRTGILFYISMLEHRIIVLADSGINSKVEQSEWDHVVEVIRNGLKTGKIADGMAEAINLCKKLLLDNGFVVRPDDTNELSDDIRIED